MMALLALFEKTIAVIAGRLGRTVSGYFLPALLLASNMVPDVARIRRRLGIRRPPRSAAHVSMRSYT